MKRRPKDDPKEAPESVTPPKSATSKAQDEWAPSLLALAKAVGKDRTVVYRYIHRYGAPLREHTDRGWNVTELRKWMASRGIKEHVPTRGAGLPGPRSDYVKEETSESADDNSIPVEDRPSEEATSRKLLVAAQAKERQAKAQLVELKLAAERGEYVPAADMKARDIARIQVVTRGLLSLVRSLPPRLVGLNTGEMEVVLKEAFRDLRTRFAQM